MCPKSFPLKMCKVARHAIMMRWMEKYSHSELCLFDRHLHILCDKAKRKMTSFLALGVKRILAADFLLPKLLLSLTIGKMRDKKGGNCDVL